MHNPVPIPRLGTGLLGKTVLLWKSPCRYNDKIIFSDNSSSLSINPVDIRLLTCYSNKNVCANVFLSEIPMSRITIKDVAREADVSISTVSHVINDTRFVDPVTKQHVQDALKKLG
ncbi:MAG TPA: LacI family DNA-binding transcriptional regulator, partial [Patescibacteria group bacterium]|nr:LacI family DNA-binding transcriptional regulator [Patescibacteria group bacterium]